MNLRKFVPTSAALLLLASHASAQTQPADRNSISGSDSLAELMKVFMEDLVGRAPEGIFRYRSLGSMVGQRQMEGDAVSTDPSCGWGSVGDNPGCQEIAPMTMQMTSSICDEEEAAGQAESLLVAWDGMSFLANNATHQQDSVTTCPAAVDPTPNPQFTFQDRGTGHLVRAGTLPSSGYVLGAGLGTGAWKDALRLVLTGCKGTDGTCSTSVPRSARCGGAARAELLGDWSNLLDGQLCTSAPCTGVKHIYRHDDDSGLSRNLLAAIGVADGGLVSRTTVLNGGGFPAKVGAIPETFPYCDGGMDEQYKASTNGSDPVRVVCDANADLCGANGRSGVVQAIRSPHVPEAFPTQQCGRNTFARVPWTISESGICPDGSVPAGGACNLPYRLVNGQRDFNCINEKNSRPASVPSTVDGRVYNHVQRNSAGQVTLIRAGYPLVASYRQDMVKIDAGFGAVSGKTYAATDTVCQHGDASTLISCWVSKETCSLGLTDRGGAGVAAYASAHEPLVVDGQLPSDGAIQGKTYPLANDVYIAALGGFEDINDECELRGHRDLSGADDFCYGEYELAIATYVMSGGVGNVLRASGQVPVPADYPNRCVGSVGSAGCGAPTVQPLTACLPVRPDDRGPPPF
jgi:hypothetical protein